MPDRLSTRRGYLTWAKNYTLPKWGNTPLTGIKARDVELWLAALDLAPKSKVNIRMLMSLVFEYAMWADLIPVERNPMGLVDIKNVWLVECRVCVVIRRDLFVRTPLQPLITDQVRPEILGSAPLLVNLGHCAVCCPVLYPGYMIMECTTCRAVVKNQEEVEEHMLATRHEEFHPLPIPAAEMPKDFGELAAGVKPMPR